LGEKSTITPVSLRSALFLLEKLAALRISICEFYLGAQRLKYFNPNESSSP